MAKTPINQGSHKDTYKKQPIESSKTPPRLKTFAVFCWFIEKSQMITDSLYRSWFNLFTYPL